MLIIVAGKLSRAKVEMNLVSLQFAFHRHTASRHLVLPPRELCNICAHPSHFLRRPQDSFASGLGVLDIPRPPAGTLAAPALAVLCQTTLYEPPGRVLVGALPISCRQKFTPARGGSGRAEQGRAGRQEGIEGQAQAHRAVNHQPFWPFWRSPGAVEAQRQASQAGWRAGGPPRWPRPADSG